jgi:hypothetical protein
LRPIPQCAAAFPEPADGRYSGKPLTRTNRGIMPVHIEENRSWDES